LRRSRGELREEEALPGGVVGGSMPQGPVAVPANASM
jgi:hypothetical protein